MHWPYDEVSLDLQLEKGLVAVRSPWLEATVSDDIMDVHELKNLGAKLNERTLTGNDLGLVNRFFGHFDEFPFCYTLPEHKNPAGMDKHQLVDTTLSGNMKSVFARVANDAGPLDLDFCPSDLEALLPLLPRDEFDWDAQAALSFASVGQTIHPESLFSVVRRYHFLELLNSNEGSQVFDGVRSLGDDEFRSAMCAMLRQNHYVTEKCQRALLPALDKAQSARDLVASFRKEEQGHDKLLERAIKSLGEEPQNVPVSVSTRALMCLLEYCATRNFLAFSMAVDVFERSNFEEIDPMAKLLMSRNFDKAAGFINAHMKINDHGKHENVARKFLFAMDLCPQDYALEAVRLLEMISLVICSVSRATDSNRWA